MLREKIDGGPERAVEHTGHEIILIWQGIKQPLMNLKEIPLSASRPHHLKCHDAGIPAPLLPSMVKQQSDLKHAPQA